VLCSIVWVERFVFFVLFVYCVHAAEVVIVEKFSIRVDDDRVLVPFCPIPRETLTNWATAPRTFCLLGKRAVLAAILVPQLVSHTTLMLQDGGRTAGVSRRTANGCITLQKQI
jgi:hypothetical protein